MLAKHLAVNFSFQTTSESNLLSTNKVASKPSIGCHKSIHKHMINRNFCPYAPRNGKESS